MKKDKRDQIVEQYQSEAKEAFELYKQWCANADFALKQSLEEAERTYQALKEASILIRQNSIALAQDGYLDSVIRVGVKFMESMTEELVDDE